MTRSLVTWDPSSKYPSARRDDTEQTYDSKENGKVVVKDYYRWLEADFDDTTRFVKDQAAFTENYINKADDLRNKIRSELTANFNYERYSAPSLHGDFYYFSYNTGLQSQNATYRQHKSRISDPDIKSAELFFDPNLLSTDGTVSVNASAFSKSGDKWAYGISKSGSDWQTIYVRSTDSPHSKDMSAGQDKGQLDDQVKHVKFSGISWTHDGKGFFYCRFPASADDSKEGTEVDTNVNQKVYYHRVGTKQSEDILVREDKEHDKSTYMYGTAVSHDGDYLVLETRKDTARKNLLHIAKLQGDISSLDFKPIITEFEADYSVIANDADLFYIQTNKDAPKDRIVTFNLAEGPTSMKELVPEDPKAVLSSASVHANDKLLLLYKIDVVDRIFLHDLKTGKRISAVGDTDLIGTVNQINGKRDKQEVWFSLASFVSPGQIFRYDLNEPDDKRLSLYRSVKVDGISADDFKTEQVFYKSKDGTSIPMFIVTPKSFQADGQAPALLYGYGGFSVSLDPMFSVTWMAFVKGFQGVLAVANLRGGSEYGEDWHQAGTLGNKQNVFDDFQAAARYLKESQTAGKVISSGGSNGGLLVAACVNQAPDLFDAGIAEVGVLDMLRFHLFTIGWAWVGDYGSPDKAEEFDFLYKYSPLHNVDASKTYPPVLLMTGDHDDRVSPLHSFKYAAALQHDLKGNKNPLLLRVELDAGHGAGKSVSKRINEAADKFTFAAASLGLEWHAS